MGAFDRSPIAAHQPLQSRAGDEFFRHRTRLDGKRDLFFGPEGEKEHGHAVIGPTGGVQFLRETDGRVVCDDRPMDYDRILRNMSRPLGQPEE